MSPPNQSSSAAASQSPPFAPTFRPTEDGSPVEYIIVTSELLVAEFDRLAAWKTRKGVRAQVRTVEWIDATYPHGVDRAERMRLFLRDAYLHWGTLWLLIGGDTDVVPTRFASSVFLPTSPEGVPGDLYFACLDGDWNGDGDARFGEGLPPGFPEGGDDADLWPELYLGRAPVRTTAEAMLFVDRVLAYEAGPPTGLAGSMLLLGEVISNQVDGATYCERVADAAPPWARTVRLYENHTEWPGALPETVNAVIDSLEAGFGIVHHAGHGFRTTMSVGSGSLDNGIVQALGNGDRLSAVFAITCSAGSIDFNAIGERFVLAPGGGAISFIGMSRFTQPAATGDFQDGFYAAIWEDSLTSVGQALSVAKAAQVPLSEPGESGQRWTQFALNLLGDPELALWTRPAEQLELSHAGTVELGASTYDVEVTVGGLRGSRCHRVPRQGRCVPGGDDRCRRDRVDPMDTANHRLLRRHRDSRRLTSGVRGGRGDADESPRSWHARVTGSMMRRRETETALRIAPSRSRS